MWHGPWKRFRSRGLRNWVLAILRNSPKNGAEIMDEIENMSQGWWRPSPGSVYPMLDGMAREGLLKKRDDGRYELTEIARHEQDWPFGPGFTGPRTIEEMLNEISGYVSYFEDLAKGNKERLTVHFEKIRALTERLSAITK